MVPAESAAMPVYTPGARMASWSYYLGLLGFIMTIISPVARTFPVIATTLLLGGVALGIIAIVLGIVGLFSYNRLSALAGLLFGALALAAFSVYVFYFNLGGFGL